MFKMKRNPGIKKWKHPLIIDGQKDHPKNKEYDIIFGHFKHDKYSHRGVPMFSFIRHPVDRIVNQYYYHKGLYERIGKTLSLQEFCEQWKNHMTYVLGDPSIYKFIGVVEMFDKSLNLMSDILQIPHQRNVIKRRVSGDKKQIPKKTRKYIEEINSVDMELYHKILNKIKKS